MNPIEFAGFLTGVLGVWLTIKQKIWCFPVGIINVCLSFFLFYHQKLYSDSIQQVFYFVLLSYGWFNWSRGIRSTELKVSYLSIRDKIIGALFVITLSALMGITFATYTDADVPYLDATATAMSFLAQYLIAKKKIENWFLWMVVNIMYVGIYMYKDLYLYAALFTIYLILAVTGYKSWKQSIKAS